MSAAEAAAATDPVDRTLAALADPARRRVVELLRERPRRAGELAAELAVSPSVMSRHLKVLRDNDVVEDANPEFDARVRIYSLRAGATAGLRSWLDAVEQGWTEQLAALKAHVEAGDR
ncbi:MAG: winged helix-turn-helix transcriptional regulator [Actinobacteria bacterium]|nr:winged helix-turn-helix transcriptional regulator [Actinomycetota bacterium]